MKTIILDPRVPSGEHRVDLTVDEVLEACHMFLNDKEFEKALNDHYNQLDLFINEGTSDENH